MSATDFNTKIDQASNAAECLQVQTELSALLSKVSTKLESFQEQDKKAGLKFMGENAIKCVCGNSVNPDDEYVQYCEDCEEDFCVDCMVPCDDCSRLVCNAYKTDEKCAILCVGCETAMLCTDCCHACDQCIDAKLCEDCRKEIGPFGEMVCPRCFDCMNSHYI